MRIKPRHNSVCAMTWTKIMALLITVFFTLIACKTTTPPPGPTASSSMAFAKGEPGGVIVDTVEVSAKVTDIDNAERNVTLMGPEGNTFTVNVGPEVVNFDQIQVGDIVNVTHTKEIVIFIDEEGASVPDVSTAIVATAPKGSQPGGFVVGTSQITATVKKIDQVNRTASLQTEDGNVITVPVRDDIDLSKRKVGENVVFQVTRMAAISIKKQ